MSASPPLSVPRRTWVLLLAAIAPGCDQQAGDDYRGEPLARLTGTITSSVDDPPATLRPLLGWSNTANPGGDTGVVEEADVTLEFPSRFHFELYRPPSDEGLNDYTRGGSQPDEARIGVAHIAAWPAEIDPQAENVDEPELYGIAEHHLLVYLDRDVQAGTFSAQLLGGELEAGFHVMDVIENGEPGCQEDVHDCMRPAPADLDTEIQIRIDLAELLDVPDWT